MKVFQKFLIVTLLFGSCTDPVEPSINTEIENFSLVDLGQGALNNAKVFGLEVFEGKMFFLNQSIPGFIDLNGRTDFSCCLNSAINRIFRPSFTTNYILQPIENLIGFVVYPINLFGGLRALNFEELLGDDGKNARIVSGNQPLPINLERNFELNGNHLMLNVTTGDGIDRIWILEIDFGDGFGSLNLINKIEITPESLGITTVNPHVGLVIGSVKKFEDRWIAQISSSGEGTASGGSYIISKEGSIQKLFGTQSDDYNFLFYDFTKISPDDFLITESPIGRIFYSNSLVASTPQLIAEFNGPLAIRHYEEKVVFFIPGQSLIASLENFKVNGASNYQTMELDRTGLNSSRIFDLQFFNGKVYLATDNGIYSKTIENFWEEVRLP
jgi:hypothetical protein